jgi:hypothetical protein
MAEGNYSGGIPHPDLHVQLPLLHRDRKLPLSLFAYIPVKEICALIQKYDCPPLIVPRELHYRTTIMDSVLSFLNQIPYYSNTPTGTWPPAFHFHSTGRTIIFPRWWYEMQSYAFNCPLCGKWVPLGIQESIGKILFPCDTCDEWFSKNTRIKLFAQWNN